MDGPKYGGENPNSASCPPARSSKGHPSRLRNAGGRRYLTIFVEVKPFWIRKIMHFEGRAISPAIVPTFDLVILWILPLSIHPCSAITDTYVKKVKG